MTAAGVDQADQVAAELVEAETDLLELELPSHSDQVVALAEVELLVELPSHSPQVVVPSVFLELVVVEAEDQADQLVAGSVVVVVDDHSDQVVAGSVVVVEVEDHSAQSPSRL